MKKFFYHFNPQTTAYRCSIQMFVKTKTLSPKFLNNNNFL